MATKPVFATYFNEPVSRTTRFTVLKENADGTVNLGGEDKKIIVSKCPLSDVPKPGHCMIEVEAPAPAADPTPPPAS